MDEVRIPVASIKGRGAASSVAHRFSRDVRGAFDDGWGSPDTTTDAYQPAERQWRITRSVIELLSRCDHPLAIVTKGSGVERDIDLLAPMARKNLAAVYVTITTLDAALARTLEPRAAAPHRRLRTIRALADAGIAVGVSVAPQIPFINDDMEKVLEAAAQAGATAAFYSVLRLPCNCATSACTAMSRPWIRMLAAPLANEAPRVPGA